MKNLLKKTVFVILLLFFFLQFSVLNAQAQLACGTRTSLSNATCNSKCSLTYLGEVAGVPTYCCGTVVDDQCLSGFSGPTNQTFDSLNPLYTHGNEDSATLTTPGAVVSRILVYALPMAGMILFVMLLWGGFEILAGSAGKKSLDAGKQRITAAFVGFILLFVSYWIMQILEIIFGVSIV